MNNEKENTESLIQINNGLSYILGIATHILYSNKGRMDKHDREIVEWLDAAIENVIYLKKPIPPLPKMEFRKDE